MNFVKNIKINPSIKVRVCLRILDRNLEAFEWCNTSLFFILKTAYKNFLTYEKTISLVYLEIWVNLRENNWEIIFICVIRVYVSYFVILVIITRALFYYYNRIASRDDPSWLSRRNNNNDDLLKYASLIIITDNRGSKHDRLLAVKHSFVLRFLTSQIFNITLWELSTTNYYVEKLCDFV